MTDQTETLDGAFLPLDQAPPDWRAVPSGSTCDWGDCGGRVVGFRFDKWGRGWLPVCGSCRAKVDQDQ